MAHIPYDVWDLILKFAFQDDSDIYKSFALTCRSFYQLDLFPMGTVKCGDDNHNYVRMESPTYSFATFLKHKQQLQSRVDTLFYSNFSSSIAFPMSSIRTLILVHPFCAIGSNLNTLFPNVHTLHIQINYNCSDPPLSPFHLPSKLTHLYLSIWGICKHEAIIRSFFSHSSSATLSHLHSFLMVCSDYKHDWIPVLFGPLRTFDFIFDNVTELCLYRLPDDCQWILQLPKLKTISCQSNSLCFTENTPIQQQIEILQILQRLQNMSNDHQGPLSFPCIKTLNCSGFRNYIFAIHWLQPFSFPSLQSIHFSSFDLDTAIYLFDILANSSQELQEISWSVFDISANRCKDMHITPSSPSFPKLVAFRFLECPLRQELFQYCLNSRYLTELEGSIVDNGILLPTSLRKMHLISSLRDYSTLARLHTLKLDIVNKLQLSSLPNNLRRITIRYSGIDSSCFHALQSCTKLELLHLLFFHNNSQPMDIPGYFSTAFLDYLRDQRTRSLFSIKIIALSSATHLRHPIVQHVFSSSSHFHSSALNTISFVNIYQVPRSNLFFRVYDSLNKGYC